MVRLCGETLTLTLTRRCLPRPRPSLEVTEAALKKELGYSVVHQHIHISGKSLGELMQTRTPHRLGC